MAQKKITDLQLISNITDAASWILDTGLQTYRASSVQLRNYILSAASIAAGMESNAITVAKLSASLQNSLVPTGTIHAFGGTSSPSGFLLCDGSAVSRTTYADLFSAIGSNYGSGDGSTTFNLPDFRGLFLRGHINIPQVTGSGSAASNAATFTAHGINRTGMPVRIISGTLSGLNTTTTYYAIVVDANTLAFATNHANALSNTRITITGSNSAVVRQWVSPNASDRFALQSGGNTGLNVGSQQEGEVGPHTHTFTISAVADSIGNQITSGNAVVSPSTSIASNPPAGQETRPNNVSVNYIIKT